MQKFKEGALVEIISSVRGNVGHRFNVGKVSNKKHSKDQVLQEGIFSYKTDLPTPEGDFYWAPESALRLVVDDGYAPSEYSNLEDLLENLLGVEVLNEME